MFDDIAPNTPAAPQTSGGEQTKTMVPPPRAIVPKKNPVKIAAIIIGLLLGLIVLGYGGYYVYDTFRDVPSIDPAEVDAMSQLKLEDQLPPLITEPTAPPAAVLDADTDSDGLKDSEELQLGTNVNSDDTDSDELSDFDEVKIYFTDPLDADSDGDSFLDGEEVENGYNPNGEGRLLNFELENTKN
jgi:hypothetical protein